MPEILPPYQVITPAYTPGMSVSVMPSISKHSFWLDDYEYYDQLGRDPLQERKIWGIKDSAARIEKLKEVLKEFPKMMHWRKILFTATVRGDEDIVKCLVEAGVDIQPDIQEVLKQQKEQGEVEKDPDDIELPDVFDETCQPVHAAASQGRLGILKLFLDSGINVDVRGEFGDTPLICAHGCSEIMHYLLDRGADPQLRLYDDPEASEWHGENARCNALERTVPHGNVDIIERLLDVKGMEVTQRVILGAIHGGHDALKLVLERGGYHPESENERDSLTEEQKQTLRYALPISVEFGDFETMKLILSYQHLADGEWDIVGPVPEGLQKTFVYGTYNAIIKDDIDKFEFLYNLGLKEHQTMSLDKLPADQRFNIQHLFDKATMGGAVNGARHLIEKYGAKPDAFRLPSGILPLYNAAMYNRAEIVRVLIEDFGADIHRGNGRWAYGPTAMWVAIQLKQLEVVLALLQHGGPVDVVDDDVRNIAEKLKAVLITGKDMRVSLKTEENARKYIDEMRNDYFKLNPPYVRVVLGPEDKPWIERLAPRKSAEQLREFGDLARVLNEEEEFLTEDFTWDDPRRNLPDYPIDDDREKELQKDDDLIPRFFPAFKAVN